MEEQREAAGFAVSLGDQALEDGMLGRELLGEVGRAAQDRVGLAFVLGERDDQRVDALGVGGLGEADVQVAHVSDRGRSRRP